MMKHTRKNHIGPENIIVLRWVLNTGLLGKSTTRRVVEKENRY